MNTIYIYEIYCTETNQSLYVGQTRNPKRRWYRHKAGYSGVRLAKALVIYPAADFRVIDQVEDGKQAANQAERDWIAKLRPLCNVSPTAGNGTRRTIQTKLKTSASVRDAGKLAKKIPVLCYDSAEVYDSAYSAAEALGINRANLCRHLNGHLNSVGGLEFTYLTDLVS